MKLRDLLNEKAKSFVVAGWHKLELDDGSYLITNMEKLDQGIVQYDDGQGGQIKDIKFTKGNAKASIEKLIGKKLNK